MDLLGDLRWHAGRALALGTLAGLLEGVALTTLIPLLHLGATTQPREVFGLSGRATGIAAVVAFVVVAGVASLSRALSQRGILRVRSEVDRRMQAESLEAIMAVNWSTFHTLGEAEIAESILAEGERTADGLQSGMQAMSGVGAVLALAAFAAFVAPLISLVALVVGSIGTVGYRHLSSDLQAQRHKVRDESSTATKEAMELVTSAKYLRSTGEAPGATERAKASFDALARTSYLVGGHLVIARFWIEAGAAIFLGSLLLVSALTGRFTPATLVFFALFYRLVPRALAFHEGVAQARLQRHWYESWKARIETLRKDRVELPEGKVPSFANAIEFQGVGFTHPGSERPVLRDVSIQVGQGEFVAVVGPSGSGKTTILDLLSGLLRPTLGSITFDGTSLHDVQLTEWQHRVGLMLQDTPLQHGTILSNITGQLPTDPRRVRSCAQAAEIDAFVSALPLGYETPVGEGGGRLSGGERQRIALARALYREPLVMLLDEPTSALDPVAEASIMRSLIRVKGRCAIVLVAHRLSTVRHADRILVLVDGAIRQSGTWAELAREEDGPFASMLREQEDPALALPRQ